jgi:hypothetical protein
VNSDRDPWLTAKEVPRRPWFAPIVIILLLVIGGLAAWVGILNAGFLLNHPHHDQGMILGSVASMLHSVVGTSTGGGGDGGDTNTYALAADLVSQITSRMNVHVDPCVDFFDYACGGFIASTPVDATQLFPQSEAIDIIKNRTDSQLYEILSESFPFISSFYATCLDPGNVNRTGHQSLLPVFALINTVAQPGSTPANFWRVLGALHRHNLVTDVFSTFEVILVDGVFRLSLHGVTTDRLYLDLQESQLTRLLTLINSTSLATVSDAQLARTVDSYVPLEQELRAKTYDIDPPRISPVQFILDAAVDETGIPLADYLSGLGDLSISSPGIPVSPIVIDRIFIEHPPYFKQIGTFIREVYSELHDFTPFMLRTLLQLVSPGPFLFP